VITTFFTSFDFDITSRKLSVPIIIVPSIHFGIKSDYFFEFEIDLIHITFLPLLVFNIYHINLKFMLINSLLFKKIQSPIQNSRRGKKNKYTHHLVFF